MISYVNDLDLEAYKDVNDLDIKKNTSKKSNVYLL
jgi:hypothetical protein